MKRTNYRIDAPGIMFSLLAGGIGTVVTGWVMAGHGDGRLRGIGLAVAASGCLPLVFGVLMAVCAKPGGSVVIGDYLPTHRYAAALAEAGLTVVRSRTAFAVALSLMWIVVARKPSLQTQ